MVISSKWEAWLPAGGGGVKKWMTFQTYVFHAPAATKTLSTMCYLYKEFSHFIMTIRASIMERDQSSNRNRNQRKYTKLNHLVQLTVIIVCEK